MFTWLKVWWHSKRLSSDDWVVRKHAAEALAKLGDPRGVEYVIKELGGGTSDRGAFAEALGGQGEDRHLSMPPTKLQEFIQAVRTTFERLAMRGETPVLLTSPAVRPYVRSIVERFRALTVVMSQNEIHPKARIKTLGTI